jgi:hypothetical protein
MTRDMTQALCGLSDCQRIGERQRAGSLAQIGICMICW